MSVISKLVTWYKHHKRRLPWRETRDPYRIFVSEIMLQQTQVDRVIDFYHAWLKQFPSWKSLAEARTDKLLHAWAGLGYNRRALQLREAAQQVVAKKIPQTMEDWIKLKGVGPYTAAAVHAITARKRLIVIDTNVRRVAGRIFLGIPYPALADDVRVGRALDRAVPAKDSYWELPQVMMDFGTAICTPKNPACATCPIRSVCKAAPKFISGRAGEKPRVASHEKKHRDKQYPDRIYRGRILAAVRNGNAKTVSTLGPMIDPAFNVKKDTEWLRAMIARLKKDKMIESRGNSFFLPR